MKKRKGLVAEGIAVVIILIVAIVFLYGASWLQAQSFAGQEYDVTFTVYSVEKSTRFGDHTNVQYGVSEGTVREYYLIGHQDFVVGGVYHLKFINVVKFHWWRGGFFIRGRVILLEQIS